MVDSTTTLTLKDAFGALKIFGEVTDGTNVYPVVSLRTNSAAVSSSNPLAVVNAAGTAIIGKVSIDQTTPGTTNAVALTAGSAIAGKFGIDQTTPGTTNAVALTAGSAIAGKFGIDQTTPGTTNAVALTAGSAIAGKFGIDQTTPGTTNAVSITSDIRERFFDVAATTLTRPANTTAYAVNDSISDNATAGSVTALVATPGDTNDYPVMLTHIRVDTTDTALAASCTLRVYVYNSDPTASTGVGGGDNAAFSNKRAGYVGTMSGSFRAFSDGGRAICVPEDGSYMIVAPASGTRNVWVQYQVLTAFTPSANSTTLIGRLVGIQGRS